LEVLFAHVLHQEEITVEQWDIKAPGQNQQKGSHIFESSTLFIALNHDDSIDIGLSIYEATCVIFHVVNSYLE
jgi:hypothetical protein